MSSYRLVDHGFTYKKIIVRRRWIGRVFKHCSKPVYVGSIPCTGHTVEAPTEAAAFREVVALHLGFVNAAAMNRRNAIVCANNRDVRRRAQAGLDALMRGDFSQLVKRF